MFHVILAQCLMYPNILSFVFTFAFCLTFAKQALPNTSGEFQRIALSSEHTIISAIFLILAVQRVKSSNVRFSILLGADRVG